MNTKLYSKTLKQYYEYCKNGEYIPYLRFLWLLTPDSQKGKFALAHLYVSVYRKKENDFIETWWDGNGKIASPVGMMRDLRIIRAVAQDMPIPPKYIIDGIKGAITYKKK